MNPPRYGTQNTELLQEWALRHPVGDGPFWAVNLMQYREFADYADGRETSITGREADDLYTPRGPIAEVGGDIVFAAEVVRQIAGDQPVWDRVAIVRYPTRSAFLAMQKLPEFQALHVHKDAGMASTIIVATSPIDLGDFAAGPAVDSTPAAVVHVLRFGDDGRRLMAAFGARVGELSNELGIVPMAFCDAEDVIIGDGRSWDQVRINAMPSIDTWDRLGADERWQAAQPLRTRAIADSYTLLVRPTLNRLVAAQRA